VTGPAVDTPEAKPQDPRAKVEPVAALDPAVRFYQKLVDARRHITEVPKRGKHESFGFNFATHDDITEVCKNALDHAGIAFIPASVRREDHGKKTIAYVTYKLCCTETGYVETIADWPGEGQDNQDKAFYKALTQSKKTFLLNLLMVPTGDRLADGDYGHGYEEKQSKSNSKSRPSRSEPRGPSSERQRNSQAQTQKAPPAQQAPKSWQDLSTNQQRYFATERKKLVDAIEWGSKYPKGYDDWIKTTNILGVDAKTGLPSLSASTVPQIERLIQFLTVQAQKKPRQQKPTEQVPTQSPPAEKEAPATEPTAAAAAAHDDLVIQIEQLEILQSCEDTYEARVPWLKREVKEAKYCLIQEGKPADFLGPVAEDGTPTFEAWSEEQLRNWLGWLKRTPDEKVPF